MFGVLKGAACAMEPGLRLQWTGHTCGVCLALQDRYGLVSRIATNYDAALLSVIYDAQTPQPQARRLSYCPLRKSFKAEVVAANSPGVDYAASMALMAASSRIRDHLEDNEGPSRLFRGLAAGVSNRWMRAARETTASLGLDAEIIEAQIRRQPVVEARPDQVFSFYARPTELAVGTAFGNTAILANRSQNTDLLHEMGRMFGRIVYLLDSYQDYATDLKTQSFNALAAAFAEGEWEQQASRIFRQAYSALRKCFHQLDLPDPALLSALLVRQLQKRGYKTLQMCDGISSGCRPLGAKATVARSAHLRNSAYWQDEDEQKARQEEQEDEEEEAREQVSRDPGCCYLGQCYYCGDCDCGDGDCCDCDCSDGDCCGCDCGDCGCCDCGDCDCGGCDCGDC